MWTTRYVKESADDMYCPYCLQLQADKFSCCHEVHFIPLKDLSSYAQHTIAVAEYEEHHDNNQPK